VEEINKNSYQQHTSVSQLEKINLNYQKLARGVNARIIYTIFDREVIFSNLDIPAYNTSESRPNSWSNKSFYLSMIW